MNQLKKNVCLWILVLCSLAGLSSLEFEGTAFADYYGDIEPGTGYRTIRSRLAFLPVLSGPVLGGRGDFRLSANLFYQPVGEPEFIETENILKEAYIYMPLGDFDLYLGQKTVSPGMTDVFSPLNCINGEYAFKLSLDDPYDTRRADLMVQIIYYPNFDDSIQLVYVPFPRPDFEPTGTVNIQTADADADVIFKAEPYLLDSPHSFYLSYSHLSGGFDLQLLYAFYTEQTPGFDLSGLSYSSILTGSASSVYTRNHTFGAAYSTSFAGIALVEELAFNLTEDLKGTDMGIKNSDITLNSQITGTLPGGTFAQLNVIYQHVINFNAGDTVFSAAADELLRDEFNGYFNQPVQNIAFLIGHLHNSFFHDRLYLALNAGFFFSTDVYLAPRAAFTISDSLKLEAGADIKTGTYSRKFLARGNLMDNFYLRFKYEF